MDSKGKPHGAGSFAASYARGAEWLARNYRPAAGSMAAVTIVMAVAAAAAYGGDIGSVKVGGVSYLPFHEVAVHDFIIYLAGALLLFVLGFFWHGKAFTLLVREERGTDSTSVRNVVFAGLRFMQFYLLSALLFGIVGAALVVLSLRVSPWFWVAVVFYAFFVSVPVYVAEYGYMVSERNFRDSLRMASMAVREQWGKLFFRLMVVGAAGMLLAAANMLPAAAMMLAVYDNATAVAMENAPETPTIVFVVEYLFIALGVVAVLCVRFAALAFMRSFYDEAQAYSAQLDRETGR